MKDSSLTFILIVALFVCRQQSLNVTRTELECVQNNISSLDLCSRDAIGMELQVSIEHYSIAQFYCSNFH